jgi:hypothetical protein
LFVGYLRKAFMPNADYEALKGELDDNGESQFKRSRQWQVRVLR